MALISRQTCLRLPCIYLLWGRDKNGFFYRSIHLMMEKKGRGSLCASALYSKDGGKMVTYFHMSSFNFSLYHFNIMSKSETRLKADYTISMAALHNNWYKLRLWDSCMTMKAASTHNPYPKLPVQHCSLPSKQAKEWLPLESVKAFCHVLGSISNVI